MYYLPLAPIVGVGIYGVRLFLYVYEYSLLSSFSSPFLHHILDASSPSPPPLPVSLISNVSSNPFPLPHPNPPIPPLLPPPPLPLPPRPLFLPSSLPPLFTDWRLPHPLRLLRYTTPRFVRYDPVRPRWFLPSLRRCPRARCIRITAAFTVGGNS